MNPIVLQIASGNTFFIGIGLTAVAFVLRLWLDNRFWVLILTTSWLLGIGLVVLSATPISFWLYGLWFALCIAVRIAFNVRTSSRLRASLVVAFAFFSVSLCLTELPYHWNPRITVFTHEPVFVLGDSISAGIGNKERTWPDVVGDLAHLKVTNLARPGATVETAMDQATNPSLTNSLVILEIGGNDLLGRTGSREFYQQLDLLLLKLKQGNNDIVMFELPLLPFWNSYGHGQRALAEKYKVALIPKSCLAGVFGSKGGTLDGLHLSQKGHNELAGDVYRCLEILQMPSKEPAEHR